MGLFGSGPIAARTLRDRILAGLGAEPQWTETGEAVTCWTSGPATTFFLIEDGPESAPDLGVLRVLTPVATVADRPTALGYCNELNLYATTNRWSVSPGEYDGSETDLLRVSCSFVVGQHSTDALAGIAQWCVREQIAIATAKMTSDIAELVGGKPCLFFGHGGGPYRKSEDWHEVVYHYDRVVTPNRELPGEPLGAEFNQALRILVREMLDEGTGAWFSAGLDDPSPYTTYETPFAWDRYPDGLTTTSTGGDVPTALVETMFGAHPHMGNGLLITMRVPVALAADALETVNALNLLDTEIPGATHSIGGWFAKGLEPTYVIYLPAVLASEANGIGFPAVMRELQLTLVRQALLARRILLRQEQLEDTDQNGPGLRVPTADHGLAWGGDRRG